MSAVAALSPFELLALYERRCLAHSAGASERIEALGLWRGIGFRVGRRSFVSGIEEINELLAVPTLTHVPGTQAWLMGVANVRGNLIPAIDLGRFLFDERTPSSERTRLLLVRQHGGTVGLLVDEVFGQRTIDDEQRGSSEEETDPRLARFVEGNVRLAEQAFGLFSMSRLVRAPDFRQAAL
ncbi:twitching motility protein PilI [Luteibacter rhizovicinus]|uniref:Twitching motility protein PilI n=1 Tax=Luteibacter rhizovicinus TaxID=242606 RepID=A0A4R3YSE2_9GAMM|nr:chemotaxis protein CheW [Luteibacter rhizovicinus]TCV94204.1 twitching motility protein PilI [Luteibacter rhizovicinus]